MRVTMVIPGSGGRYYCQNCVRDTALHARLAASGIELTVAQMYLPSHLEPDRQGFAGKVFFGAVNSYLQEKFPLFRHTPRWLDSVLDSNILLGLAARKAGSTRAAGLGEMTASMLMGVRGRQAKELRRLVAWLGSEARPDVVLLSNALLLGLLPEIKSATGAAVVCSLQDEAPWVDAFDDNERELCWKLMSDLARQADALTAVSGYYAGVFSERTGLERESISVVYPGLDFSAYAHAAGQDQGLTVGFLSRASLDFGLDELAAAVESLCSRPDLRDLKLAVSGGWVGANDESLLESVRARLGPAGRFVEAPSFDLGSRVSFLSGLSVFCVPAKVPEAFGMHALEAMACAVPVVMPAMGGYTELIEAAGGGELYEPGDRTGMEEAIRGFLLERELARETGRKGREKASGIFSAQRAADAFREIFERVANGKRSTRG